MPIQPNPALVKLRATLQIGESLSNCRRLLARFAGAITDGVPAQGISAQELIDIIGQDEANLIIAANAIFVASPLPVVEEAAAPAPAV
ncbi:MAG: hypothetical protein EBR82_21525 [Caulobacteraceae bacterium]|nr:hypothetical protein [Caulobacteraceae bacterium]